MRYVKSLGQKLKLKPSISEQWKEPDKKNLNFCDRRKHFLLKQIKPKST